MVDIRNVLSRTLYFPNEAKLRSLKITQDQLKCSHNNNQVRKPCRERRVLPMQYQFASQITSPEELENVYLNINGRLLQIKDIARSGIRPREKRHILNGAQLSLGRDQTINAGCRK
ncbi:MAG: hypothetical protein ACLUPL_03480 [Butyricimonas virosa]